MLLIELDLNVYLHASLWFVDVCNLGNLPEVEILSLIEEQIPKYRLRADTITNFCGYDNQDWIQTPLIPIDEDLELSNDQIQETLKYFGKDTQDYGSNVQASPPHPHTVNLLVTVNSCPMTRYRKPSSTLARTLRVLIVLNR